MSYFYLLCCELLYLLSNKFFLLEFFFNISESSSLRLCHSFISFSLFLTCKVLMATAMDKCISVVFCLNTEMQYR